MRYPAQTPSRRCPIPGCKVRCHPAYVMCVNHWRMVSKALQDAVWREYRLHPGSAAHLAACHAAIRSAQEMAPVLPVRSTPLQPTLGSLALAALLFAICNLPSSILAATSAPPIPGHTSPTSPTSPTTRKPAGVTQGMGAADLLIKPLAIVAPPIWTNRLELRWNFPTNDLINSIFVVFNPTNQAFQTNYFEVQSKTNLSGTWRVLGTTNRPPWPITSTNRTGYFRLRSYLQ